MNRHRYNESPEDTALRQKLSAMIEDLGSDEHTFAGRSMFRRLLHDYGPHNFIDFIKAKSVVLDEEEGFNEKDFNGHAQDSFKRAPIKLLSRRGLFSVLAGGYAGAVYTVYGGAALSDQIARGMGEPSNNSFHATKEKISEQWMPSADLAIGSTILSESYEAWLNAKLKQVAEAVWQVNQGIKREGIDSPSR